MKKLNLILKLVFIGQLMLFNSIIAQDDLQKIEDTLKYTARIYSVENGTFYYKKPNLTAEDKNFSKTVKFENLSSISFSKNKKIILENSFNQTDTVEIKFAQGLKTVSGSNLGAGILIGASLGTIIGFIIGSAVDEGIKDDKQSLKIEIGKPIFAVIGLLTGGLIGGITGGLISNDDYLDLSKYDEDRKVLALLNHLKNK